jgi:DNA-binding GntR family transcriptional regulator
MGRNGAGGRGVSARKPESVALSGEAMYERIFTAIIEHRLPPGAKLVEDRLSAIFGVSRTRVRQVLARLSHEGIVTTHPNRGAFVSEPTIEQAREVFEARRLIEPQVARKVALAVTPAQIARLRDHLALEAKAASASDRRALIRLTGDFHMLLAEMGGNATIARILRELESLTCLVIYLYDAPTAPACRGDDHALIVEALARHDAAAAAKSMRRHLEEVEASLRLESQQSAEIDLEAILS